MAWRPFKKQNTIVRTGYSIFYSGSSYAQIAGQMAAQPPFATTAIAHHIRGGAAHPSEWFHRRVPTLSPTLTPSIPISGSRMRRPGISAFRTRCRTAWWSIRNTSGPRARTWESWRTPTAPVSGSISQQQLQIANATNFTYQTDGANSIYNAAQVRITRRLSRSVSANALYTFSKSIDNASSFSGTGGTAVQFLNNWRLERGLSTFDQRHNLSTTACSFRLRWASGASCEAAAGEAQAAQELEPAATFTRHQRHAADGVRLRQPRQYRRPGRRAETCAPRRRACRSRRRTALFQSAAFTTPPAGQFGNAGRNTIPGLVPDLV